MTKLPNHVGVNTAVELLKLFCEGKLELQDVEFWRLWDVVTDFLSELNNLQFRLIRSERRPSQTD